MSEMMPQIQLSVSTVLKGKTDVAFRTYLADSRHLLSAFFGK